MEGCGRPAGRRTETVRRPVGSCAGIAAALALVLTLLLAVGPGQSSARASGLKAMWGPATRDGVSLFPAYRALGVNVYEDVLRWNEIARRRPRRAQNASDRAYRWPPAVTQAVAEAKRYDMQVALEIIGSPPWANGHKAPKWAPHRLRDFAEFAIAASRRYPSVHLWMIWGEPSRSHNFRPLTPATPYQPLTAHQKIAPHLYSRMLDAAYGALKSATRANVVIGGMTDTAASISPQQWIENMRLPDGRPPRLDMYGHNPFTLRSPNLSNPPSPEEQLDFSDLGRLHELVDRNLARPGDPGPPIFLSEWTIPTAPDRAFNFHVDPRVQALWITRALQIARRTPWIYALGWIPLYDAPPFNAGGLIRVDGTKKLGYFAWMQG
jgi:hypothetical protein